MLKFNRVALWLLPPLLLTFFTVMALASTAGAEVPVVATHWDWCGWGGGGFFWAAAYHPARPGVIYMGGDVAGCYKTEDDGRHWRMVNNGLIDYAVYGLAVDPSSPDTVYAITESGTCKSTDAGEHWANLPQTNKGELGIVAERHVSVRPLAVDPTDSRVVYAATPSGVIYKSEDGAASWHEVFNLGSAKPAEPTNALRLDLPPGPPYFGGLLVPLALPSDVKPADCRGIKVSLRSNGVTPRTAHVSLSGANHAVYLSKNLADQMGKAGWQEINLSADDFAIDPQAARQHPDEAKAWPRQPDWRTLTRMDFACSGTPKALVIELRTIGLNLADARQAALIDFASDKHVTIYGGFSAGAPKPPAFSGISVSRQDPRLVLAASPEAGLFASRDAGKTWEPLATAPKSARYAVAGPADENVLYGAFDAEGMSKSTDGGRTWKSINDGIKPGVKITDVAVSPANPNELACIGSIDWNGYSYWSDNAGATWHQVTNLKSDAAADPTVGMGSLSSPTNVTYCPTDPTKLFISSNWRPVFSEDGGRSWQERDRGADISCVYDIRFSKGRAYAACMDEGVLFTEDDGATWWQAWPRGGPGADKIAGHDWRLAISDNGRGGDRIVSTCSPWNADRPNCVIVSDDGGKTYKASGAGLPNYRSHANTMWGQSYARALAADPSNPSTLYLGMDGDAEGPGKPGGGVFKSTDGGLTWAMLPHQPPARRAFFGLAVDPTDPRRIYWAACGAGGGLYRSDDAGNAWQRVFQNEQWLFNVLVAPDGAVYAPGQNLWRSADHGQTWKKLTNLSDGQIMGLEVDPRHPNTLWLSTVKHGGAVWGQILKTTDAGATWQDITGDIGFRKPAVLRFNPATNELWAGGVGLFKLKQ